MMPYRALLLALKLVRGSEQDMVDGRWWMTDGAVIADAVRAAIATLPDARHRDTAARNLARMC